MCPLIWALLPPEADHEGSVLTVLKSTGLAFTCVAKASPVVLLPQCWDYRYLHAALPVFCPVCLTAVAGHFFASHPTEDSRHRLLGPKEEVAIGWGSATHPQGRAREARGVSLEGSLASRSKANTVLAALPCPTHCPFPLSS